MSAGVLVALVAALASPVVAYLTAVWRLSGRVQTSEAKDLWKAQEDFRADLLERNEFLRGRLDTCSTKIDDLEQKLLAIERKNGELSTENGTLHKLVDAHEETIKRLETENASLRGRNDQLERRVTELEAHLGS